MPRGPRSTASGQEADAERRRLLEARDHDVPWRRWGPYLSERQWGTVREDYSGDGDAWSYLSHDQARSRAYRWGEDGIAGYSDDDQILCFALSLWNGRDPILKERLFGLTNSEGNHGEDVKEYYFYLDATPTNSYLRFLYKYPQAAYPYEDLVSTNRGAVGPTPSTSCSTPASSTTTGTSTSSWSTPRRTRRTPRSASRSRTAVRRQRPSTCCRPSGSATPGRGAAMTLGPRCAGPSWTGGTPSTRPIPISARTACCARTAARCCSPRTRRTRNDSPAPPIARRTSRTGSMRPSSTVAAGRSIESASGPRPRPTTS